MTDPNQREIIVAILDEVIEQGRPSHIVLAAVLEKYQYLTKQQRSFITRTSMGTMERLLQIDAILAQFVKKPAVAKMKPLIRSVLRSSVYQIVFMKGVPDRAVCNEAVAIVKKHGLGGLSGFVNGVLRNISRKKETITYRGLSENYAMPQWIVDALLAQYGEKKAEEILAALLLEKKTAIRINTEQMSAEELTERLQVQGITVEPCRDLSYARFISGYDYLRAIPEFIAGDFYVQDYSSMMVAEHADLHPGDVILDVCAAPGGKSLHAAQLLAEDCTIEARDLTDAKVALIEENIKRTGVSCIRTKRFDAAVRDEAAIASADVVICDVPCSGLGVIAGKPDIKLHMTPERQRSLVALQQQILQTVSAYVKPGGVLLYSTCTILSSENEDNVRAFLAEHEEYTEEESQQILPTDGAYDGFYFARLRRRVD